jgi:hypothetical protein
MYLMHKNLSKAQEYDEKAMAATPRQIRQNQEDPHGLKGNIHDGMIRTVTKKKEHVALGIIRLDYDYPAAPGDIDHPDSYDYAVFYRPVPGFTFEMC